jgi:hypothetical protein
MESGLFMPMVKQCMQFVNWAWNNVSEYRIINCWQKYRILSNFENRLKRINRKNRYKIGFVTLRL